MEALVIDFGVRPCQSGRSNGDYGGAPLDRQFGSEA